MTRLDTSRTYIWKSWTAKFKIILKEFLDSSVELNKGIKMSAKQAITKLALSGATTAKHLYMSKFNLESNVTEGKSIFVDTVNCCFCYRFIGVLKEVKEKETLIINETFVKKLVKVDAVPFILRKFARHLAGRSDVICNSPGLTCEEEESLK